jgi:hypothetical protein
VLFALVASACGGTDDRSVVTLSRPTGSDEVVVQVMVTGGFVPVDAAVSAVPTATVLGDGTVITPAPVIAIYPGPAITPLQSVQVPAETVDDLVQRAAELGLLGDLDYGQPPVADAPDTIVTVTANGREHRHVANALGVSDGLGGARRQVSEQAEKNRQALRSFVGAVEALPPGEAPWRPSAVAVYALGDYVPEPDLPQPAREWPLATKPAIVPAASANAIPCTVIDGADVDVLLATLKEANARTPWMVGGRAVSLAFRPVVPGQPGCPDR